jgi:anti-sigma B factor antagonist
MIHNNIRTFGGSIAVVSFRGQLVSGSEIQTFRNIMQALIENEYRYITIDLGGIKKMDCGGLGELVRFHTQARAAGSTVALQKLPRRVRDLLVITRLVTLFESCDCEIARAA